MSGLRSWLPKRCGAPGFVGDQRGATSIEYGLIAMLVAIGLLAGLKALGQGNASSWGDTSTKITDAMKGGGGSN